MSIDLTRYCMWPYIVFRVNLLPTESGTLLSYQELLNFAKSKSTFIPGILGGSNLALKHGDTFVLTGEKALYLKKIISQNQTSAFYITYEESYPPEAGGVKCSGLAPNSVTLWPV